MAAMNAVGAGLGELCWGQRCPACGDRATPDEVLCSACWGDLPRFRGQLCLNCLAAGGVPTSCLRHAGPVLHAPLVWDERAASVVHALKYRGARRAAAALAAEIAASLPSEPPPGLVVEVPLHPARHRERGYNQAALLASALSRLVGAPWAEGIVRRVRATRTQTALDPAARARNVAGAFRVREPAWVKGRRVLLVDDVATTGATLRECARVLAEAGARVDAATASWVQSPS
jgi:ComF family protein